MSRLQIERFSVFWGTTKIVRCDSQEVHLFPTGNHTTGGSGLMKLGETQLENCPVTLPHLFPAGNHCELPLLLVINLLGTRAETTLRPAVPGAADASPPAVPGSMDERPLRPADPAKLSALLEGTQAADGDCLGAEEL